jgi:hypothetical protein
MGLLGWPDLSRNDAALCTLRLSPGKNFGNGAILESRAFAVGGDLEADALT